MADRTCSVPACEKPTRDGSGAIYCGMHYHRLYRHGSLERTATSTDAPRVRKPRRYQHKWDRTHPLSQANGMVYVHRAVLYDDIGIGPHLCHWCHRPINWYGKTHPDAIHVDHLNGQTDDNDPLNLAPSCRGCNAGRGIQERSTALREAGWWSNHDTIANLTSSPRRQPIEA